MSRLQAMRRPNRVTAVLGALVVLGAGLRLAFVVAYRPAFLGYPDSGIFYVASADGPLFGDPWHVAGYAAFLRALHVVGGLGFTVVVQHGLGIAAAILLYLAVSRIGGPAWIALVPAAVVLLGGDQLFIEHAVLSESLFTPLLAGAVYASARCVDGEGARWPVAAGGLAALAATTRVAGVPLVAVLALWVAALPASAARLRVLRAGAAAAAGAVVILGYLAVAHDQTGDWSLTPNGALTFYARVATFADCREFTPPTGTAWLCDPVPPDERRHEPRWYLASGGPLVHRYGSADEVPRSAVPHVSRFARAVVLHQPIDWLRTAASDFGTYVGQDPRVAIRAPAGFTTLLTSPYWTPISLRHVRTYYGDDTDVVERHGLLEALRDYAGAIRIRGVPMALLLVLALIAPLACRSRLRLGALLFAGVAFTVMAVPVLTHDYDARFGVPAYGPLAAAAAMGALGIATRLRRRPAR